MKKQYFNIDENGYIIDSILLDPFVDFIPPNFIPAWEATKVLFTPKYCFETQEWIEGKSNEEILEQAKISKIQELEEACSSTLVGYFTVEINGQSYSFSADAEAQMNFERVDRAFEKSRITDYTWTCYLDGELTRLNLNAETFETVYFAYLNHISSNIEKLRDFLSPLVKGATSIEEVKSIQWNG